MRLPTPPDSKIDFQSSFYNFQKPTTSILSIFFLQGFSCLFFLIYFEYNILPNKIMFKIILTLFHVASAVRMQVIHPEQQQVANQVAEIFGYKECAPIGSGNQMEGSNGRVFRCVTKEGQTRAVKVAHDGEDNMYDILEEGWYNRLAWFRAELNRLSADAAKYFEKKQVVEGMYQGVCLKALESDYYPVTLYALLRAPDFKALSPADKADKLLTISKHLLEAVALLQMLGCEYRDLKPANLAVDPTTLDIKLLDWGIMEYNDVFHDTSGNIYHVGDTPMQIINRVTNMVGNKTWRQEEEGNKSIQMFRNGCGTTKWYEAPDFQKHGICEKNAVYAVGVTLADLVLGNHFMNGIMSTDCNGPAPTWKEVNMARCRAFLGDSELVVKDEYCNNAKLIFESGPAGVILRNLIVRCLAPKLTRGTAAQERQFILDSVEQEKAKQVAIEKERCEQVEMQNALQPLFNPQQLQYVAQLFQPHSHADKLLLTKMLLEIGNQTEVLAIIHQQPEKDQVRLFPLFLHELMKVDASERLPLLTLLYKNPSEQLHILHYYLSLPQYERVQWVQSLLHSGAPSFVMPQLG